MTNATTPLAAAVKGARSIGLGSANVTVHALETAIAENEELRKRVEELTDRVIAESTNRVDAGDLQRENTELRKLLADAPTSEAAIAKLREWSASSGHEYGPGAVYIAMSVAMARKILDEIDRLTLELAAAKVEA